ncbi:MAG: hypothetical protein LBG80_18015 [Bacteroidales bacterium]|jgi:putative NADH-flavin reductase|nr:hypothetical protein [Bacteroidales bacterium]
MNTIQGITIEKDDLGNPLSIDTALEAIGFIISAKCKELQSERDVKQIQILHNELKMLNKEMLIVYGLDGDEETRTKIYNKINEVYCPQIKSNVLTPEYEFATD